MKTTKKQVEVTINRGKGMKETFVVPLLWETTTGFVCQIGQKESPATEWFARRSKCVNSHVL